MKLFTDQDLIQIAEKGITQEQIKTQLATFANGTPYINLQDPATINKGILRFDENEKKHYIAYFEKRKKELEVIKFVPASGAATRMFKTLFEFLKNYNPAEETINAYINRTKTNAIQTFFVGVEKLPFYELIHQRFIEKYPDFLNLPDHYRKYYFVKILLDKEEFNYGSSPKGLLPFHKYKSRLATAVEEHLYEAALHSTNKDKVQLHFTISKDHQDKFKEEINNILKSTEAATGVSFKISFSFQKESTDTIAVTENNKPFRLKDGTILFRPSGHGALIENLNEQHADIIFIKNIDNVAVADYMHEIALYKKILVGKLLEIQTKAFEYARFLDKESPTDKKIQEIIHFLKSELNVHLKNGTNKFKEIHQIAFLKEKLNVPIRVCGMVKNEGDPGGGPFWVKDEDGNISLQIVEAPQIDPTNVSQQKKLKAATHFNPVDIVCGIKNYKGEKYDLLKFVNQQHAFITTKTNNGRNLKALELPGLWNGAMGFWNSVFVEVPLNTFNPVKTVIDLLKPTHQE